jgi:putative endonuclease
MVEAWVYMLRCADGSYYVGSHRGPDVALRVGQHQAGEGGDYTRKRRPVTLVWAATFPLIVEAIAFERQLKGWSRSKKEALMASDWRTLVAASKRRGGKPAPRDDEVLRGPATPAASG